MVDAPAAALATATWEATLAKPTIFGDLFEQIFQESILAQFLLKGEVKRREKAFGGGGRVDYGKRPKLFHFGATRAIEADLLVSDATTSGAIHPEDAAVTSIDNALPVSPLRKLSGDYGCIYGTMPMGLDEELRGDGSGDGYRDYVKDVIVPSIGQQMSNMLAAGFYSDGTADQIDGLAYWRRTAGGAKWNSNAMAVDTFLQGQAFTCTEAQFVKAKLREAMRQSHLGPIGGVVSQGHKPNIMICTTALFDKMKGWIDDKQVIQLPPATTAFVELGSPEEYLIFDGMCCFPDAKLDYQIDGEFGLFYLLHTDYMHVIMHKKFNFTGIDPLKAGGDTAENLPPINLPNYLWKQVFKKIAFVNFFYARPRNLLYGTIT